MITLTITDEKLQASFDKAFEALLTPGSYDNPIKKSLDNLLSYSGDKEIKQQIDDHVKNFITNTLATPMFQMALGQAVAAEIAKREVDKLKR